MIATGLDSLLADLTPLRGRRYGLLAHQAAVTGDCRPIHLALSAAGCRPAALFGPEHGFYGVDQDMVAAADIRDPLTGVDVHSLYGEHACSLKPQPMAFADLDLLVIDLQDVGARYYTFAATAVWAAEVALRAGREVWILDRPNPLGGVVVEGDLPRPGYESFVGAFRIPVRHGLTLGELATLVARADNWPAPPQVVRMRGWRRAMTWAETGLPWIAPSPNMPTPTAAALYPGMCLIEATQCSEGRGTTRPFQLLGAPGIDAVRLAETLQARELPGLAWVPTFFKPQFQKHRGEVCAGVELVIIDGARLSPYRTGVELLAALHAIGGVAFAWRAAPYEFVSDRPAIDLLTGGPECRTALESGDGLADWIASWAVAEADFRDERRAALLYPETPA